jgi:hypothetical protein
MTGYGVVGSEADVFCGMVLSLTCVMGTRFTNLVTESSNSI